MIHDAYKSGATQAILGPGHGATIPDVLWGGFLDATLTLLGMTGTTVNHNSFGATATGVDNIEIIDAGVAGAGWAPEWFGLFDGSSGAQLVLAIPITPFSPAAGDSMIFAVGDLVYNAVNVP